jgi:hypothetical protein
MPHVRRGLFLLAIVPDGRTRGTTGRSVTSCSRRVDTHRIAYRGPFDIARDRSRVAYVVNRESVEVWSLDLGSPSQQK